MHIPNAGSIVPVAFVSHPGVADADFENAVSQFSTKVDAMAESDRKALAQAADKAGVLKGKRLMRMPQTASSLSRTLPRRSGSRLFRPSTGTVARLFCRFAAPNAYATTTV